MRAEYFIVQYILPEWGFKKNEGENGWMRKACLNRNNFSVIRFRCVKYAVILQRKIVGWRIFHCAIHTPEGHFHEEWMTERNFQWTNERKSMLKSKNSFINQLRIEERNIVHVRFCCCRTTAYFAHCKLMNESIFWFAHVYLISSIIHSIIRSLNHYAQKFITNVMSCTLNNSLFNTYCIM